jgi:hypothetical protein
MILGVVEPISHGRRPGHVFRKINEFFRASVPDVEEVFLLSPNKFQTSKFIEDAPLAGGEDAAPAPDEGLGLRKTRILDRVLPEVIEIIDIIYRRSDTDVFLHESGKRRGRRWSCPEGGGAEAHRNQESLLRNP